MSDNLLFNLKTLSLSINRCINNEITSKQHPTSRTQIYIIDYLYDHRKQPVYQKDIEEHLKSSKATISSILSKMEEHHVIYRRVNPNDSRYKEISLTNGAIKHVAIIREKAKYFDQIITHDIDSQKLNITNEVIEQMIHNLETR